MRNQGGWIGHIALAAVLLSTSAFAAGVQLDHFEPTPAGELFLGVDLPWYHDTRLLAGGLTLDLAHDPVVGGTYDAQGNFQQTVAVISTQLVAHLDLALAPLDWLLVSASLPVTLAERGTPAFGVAPISGMAAGDPRLGVDVKLPLEARMPFSLHLAGRFWVPAGAAGRHAGDSTPRGRLEAVVEGGAPGHLRWAGNAGLLLRQQASLTGFDNGLGASGNEVSLSGAVGYVDPSHPLELTGEAMFAGGVGGGRRFAQSFELLLGASYTFLDAIRVGPAIDLGVIHPDGTPALRGLFRIAYLPTRPERAPEVAPVGPAPAPLTTASAGPVAATEAAKVPAKALPRLSGPASPISSEPAAKAAVVAAVEPAPAAAKIPAEAPAAPRQEAAAPAAAKAPAETPASPRPEASAPVAAKAPAEMPATPRPVAAAAVPASAPPPFIWTVPADPLPSGCQDEPAFPEGRRLLTVHFDLNSSAVAEPSQRQLAALAKALRAAPGARIAIEGSTDPFGADQINAKLSQQRAKTLADLLRSAGVSADRIVVRALGSDHPLCAGSSAPERAADRRGDVKLVATH